jgi:hypothetical protein
MSEPFFNASRKRRVVVIVLFVLGATLRGIWDPGATLAWAAAVALLLADAGIALRDARR